jgi:hypothetical protein
MSQMLLAIAVQALCLAHLADQRACGAVLLPAQQAWMQQQLQQQAAVYLWWGTQAHQAEGLHQSTPGVLCNSHGVVGGACLQSADAVVWTATELEAQLLASTPVSVLICCHLCLLCRSEYARSEMDDGSATGNGPADEQGPEHDLLPDLPPSWVPKLTIPRDMLDMRCPRVSVGGVRQTTGCTLVVRTVWRHWVRRCLKGTFQAGQCMHI